MNSSCPVPVTTRDTIVLGHGGGGRLSAELLDTVFLPAFSNSVLNALEDQASLDVRLEPGARIAMTTDSFVVRPIFFPGGDIGELAVSGTINDLVVGGARPHSLTASFILEEGLRIEELQKVVRSMRACCDRAGGIRIVAGDTKVVDRGKGDKIFINTTGLGIVPPSRQHLSAANAQAGDVILCSGTIGDHGMAIMAAREGLELESETIRSDVAPLHGLVESLLEVAPNTRCMRDPTRGGVATALIEIAQRSNVGVLLDEGALPISAPVRAACELLGIDPLYVANEGKLVAIVPPDDVDRALAAMRNHELGRDAAIVGRITAEHPRAARLKTPYGKERAVSLLSGEQLPRIC